MKLLTCVAPGFVSEVIQVLNEENLSNLSSQLSKVQIDRCTYDSSVQAGYIYLLQPKTNSHVEELQRGAVNTFAFAAPYWFNIDVDQSGSIYGIEFLGRQDVFDKLREAHML